MTKSQIERFQEWAFEQEAKAAKMQNRLEAYYGATGGAYTYMYTPTSLGEVLVVQHNLTKEKIDLTEYENW